MAWYYALWMVKVLENVFRGIIFSFAVNSWSNLWQYWNQMLAIFLAAIFVLLREAQIWRSHSEPNKFLLHTLRKNSAAEDCIDVRLGQVVNCPRRDFAQKAKSRGGTLVTRSYIKESTYSWNIQSYSQYRKNVDLLEQGPRGIGR